MKMVATLAGDVAEWAKSVYTSLTRAESSVLTEKALSRTGPVIGGTTYNGSSAVRKEGRPLVAEGPCAACIVAFFCDLGCSL